MNQCETGKVRYDSEHKARQARVVLGYKGKELTSYPCRDCFGFHLTTKRMRKRRGR